MAFDLSRLRTDQLVRLSEVNGDLKQLSDDELEELLGSQEDYSDIGAGLERAGASLELGLAGLFGSEGMAESALRSLEDVQRQYTPDVPSILESFEEKGVLGGIADLPEYAQEQLFASAPQMLAQFGAGAIATRFGGPRAGMTTAGAVATPFFAGMNIERQLEEQGIGFDDAQVAKAYAVGVGQATLDSIIGRVLGVFGPLKGAKKIADAAQKGMARRIAGAAGVGAGIEAVTESSQQALEILQANPEKLAEFDENTRKELFESAIAGGLVGGIITAPTGIPSGNTKIAQAEEARTDLQAHLEEERQDSIKMEEVFARFGGQPLLERQNYQLESKPLLLPSPEGVESLSESVVQLPADFTGPQRPSLKDLEVQRGAQVMDQPSPIAQAEKTLRDRGRLELAINRFYDRLESGPYEDPINSPIEYPQVPLIGRVPPRRPSPDIPTPPSVIEMGAPAAQAEPTEIQSPVMRAEQQLKQLGLQESAINKFFDTIEALPEEQMMEAVINPADFINRNTRILGIEFQPGVVPGETIIPEVPGRAPVSPLADARRRTGIPAPEPEPVDLAEDRFKRQKALGLVDPFNDPENKRLFDQFKRQQAEGKKSAATTTRRKLERRLNNLGFPSEYTSRAVSQLAEDPDQIRLFSMRQAAENAQAVRDKAIADAYTQPVISDFAIRSERIRQALRGELNKLGLSDVALKMENIIRPDAESLAEGVTESDASGKIAISLSSQIYDPSMSDTDLKARLREVMNHEMIHAMRMLGVLNDSEYSTLVNAARKQKYTDRNGVERKFTYLQRAMALYSQDTASVQEEEAVAELFRDWAAGRKKIGGKPQSLFQKVVNFIKTLGKSLHQEGFDDVNKIFEQIQRGEIGSRTRKGGRERAGRGGDTVMYSRRGSPEMGINVRYDAQSGIDYAEEIVSGRKTLETRNTDSLRPYVGQRVGIVRTGRGPAEAIGAVTIGEPAVADQADFDSTRGQHLVPAGSTFDIEPGGTKFMYPMLDPEVFDQPVAVGRGIVARRLGGTEESAIAQKEERAQARQQMFSKRSIRPFPPIKQMGLPESKQIIGGTYLDFTDPTKSLEDQEIFNNRAFSEGGIYINQQTGRPALIVDDEREVEVNVTNKGPTGLQATYPQEGSRIKTNLFKQEAGWKWKTPGFENIETVISVTSAPLKMKLKSGSDHAYTLATNFLKPYTLTTFPDDIDKKTGRINQPSLRPSTIGEVRLGKVVGQIIVRGRPHDVYESVDIVDPDDSPMQFITASEAGIDDAEGTKRFSRRANTSTMAPELREWITRGRGLGGVPQTVYHSTYKSYPAMRVAADDIGIHFGTDQQARSRLDELSVYSLPEYIDMEVPIFPRIISAKIQLTRPLQLTSDPGDWSPVSIRRALLDRVRSLETFIDRDIRSEVERAQSLNDPYTEAEIAELRNPTGRYESQLRSIERFKQLADRIEEEAKRQDKFSINELSYADGRKILQSEGYDGIIYRNQYETGDRFFESGYGQRRKIPLKDQNSYIVFDPKQIYVIGTTDVPFTDVSGLAGQEDVREGMEEDYLDAVFRRRQIRGLQYPSESQLVEARSRGIPFEDLARLFEEGEEGRVSMASPFESRFSRRYTGPRAEQNPFNIVLDETVIPIYPGTDRFNSRKEGAITKAEAVRELYERFVRANGGTEPLDRSDESKELIARKMATEAIKALEYDNNAIGWYDAKISEAKRILKVIEPRIFETQQNEDAFDYALAVTSNGQAVTENFMLALDAFDYYLRTGRFPAKEWNAGGERKNAMKKAWTFFNTYNEQYEQGAVELSLAELFDADFTFKDLVNYITEFNKTFGTKITKPSSELTGAKVKGSRVLGPKIGQGFYQNIRGNFEPLTADIWWMRMWNRMINDPFKAKPSKAKIAERREAIRLEAQAPSSPVIKQVIQEALSLSGLTRSQLRTNKNVDALADAIDRRWEAYFKNYQNQYGKNPDKPQFFKDVKNHAETFKDVPVETPRSGGEKQFMIDTVDRAKELLREVGVNISTADFQALMWYPEKRLFRMLGVRPGRGEDNDYVDAALIAAKERGIPDERVEEARADTGSGQLDDRGDTGQPDAAVYPRTPEDRFSKRYTGGQSARLVANRAGTNGQVWNVTGTSGRVRGLNVVQSFDVAPEFAVTYADGDVSTPTIYELKADVGSATDFQNKIQEARQSNPFGAAVYVYPTQTDAEETGYSDMRLFTTEDGTAGFALKGDDIVSVFNTRGNGLKNVSNSLVRLAVEQGGRRLDGFDTVLPELYSSNGFKSVSRLAWDEEKAPSDWDKNAFRMFNQGEPDVVFMAYQPPATEFKPDQGVYATSFDEAVEIQVEAAKKYSRRFSATAPSGFDLDAIVNRVIQPEPETNPIAIAIGKLIGQVEGETFWQAFTRNAVNRFAPGYLLDSYVQGKIVEPAESVGRAMELSQNMTGRVWALSELGAMKYDKDTGTLSVIEAQDNKGLKEIFAPVGNKYKDEYHTYAIARRELKLRQQGRVGFQNLSAQDASNTVNGFEQKYPFFKQVHDDYQLFNRRMVQLGIDAGLITKKQGDTFMDMDYVPYYRFAEPPKGASEFSKSMAAKAHASLTDPNVFEKQLEGGIIKIGDLYENITRNSALIVSAALKNHAMQKTAEALDKAEKLGGPKTWGRRAKEGETGEMITFYENGKSVKYKIEDPALWSALAGLTAKQKEGWVKGMETIAGFLRSGVTLSPGFQLANLWRGKIDAYVKVGVEPHRFDKTIKAIRDVYGNNEDVARFKIVSGMGGFLYGADSESLAKSIKRTYRLQEAEMPKDAKEYFQRVRDRVMQGVQALEKTGEASEMAERIVIMRQLMEQGMTEKEAIFQGLNLINFGRRGAGGGGLSSALVNYLIPMVPFLNARIQGLYKLAEDPNQPGSIRAQALKEMYGRALLITAGSALAGAFAMGDDRWENETLVEKVTNDIIYIGDYKLRLPRAFEVGSLFGALPVMIMDDIFLDNGLDTAQAFGHIIGQTFQFQPIPQGFLPVFEVLTNYDSFRGAPLEGIALQGLPDELRAYGSTPYLYKFFSRNGLARLGLSPLEIQQLFEGYLGTMASNFMAATDTILSQTGAIPERPDGLFGNAFADSALQISGLNRFIREDGTGASRFVSEFYELKRDIDQTYSAIRDAANAGNREEIDALLGEKGKALGYRTYFNQISRQLTQVNKSMDMVRRNPDMSSEEKKAELLRLRKLKVEVTRKIVVAARESGYFD